MWFPIRWVIIFQLLALNRLVTGSMPVIVAEFGDDVTIPCTFSLEHNSSLPYLVVTWQLVNTAQVVHSYYYQVEQLAKQDPAYRNRTSLFVEELPLGNASLRLRAVRLEDEAQYLCSISSVLYRSSHTVSLRIAGFGGSQDGSYSLQDSQPLTCSVYVVGPAEFLVNGNPQDVDSGGFSDGNTIECQLDSLKLEITAPYSEPKLTLDLGRGLAHMSSSGGYPRPAVEWVAVEGNNVTEESRTTLWTGPRGLYSINSSIPICLGSGNNYTFILKNPLLGQQMVRFLAIVGSCHGEAISSEHRLHLFYGLTVGVLLAISFWLLYLHVQSRVSRRN